MAYVRSTPGERSGGAIGATLLTVLLGYVLVLGLAFTRGESSQAPLSVFDIAEPPPSPVQKIRPHLVRSSRPEGAASPPNLRSEATEIVAPVPLVPIVTPPPVVAAPIAGTGADPSMGSAEVAGPGTGSGGEGNGRGSGGDGDGEGGGERGDETAPEWVRGDLRDSDYPKALADAGVAGTVGVRYVVWTDGRVRDCEVDKSSGNAQLDATTCRLIRERFRFRPSRDRRGRAVPAIIVENHSWAIHREPAEPQPTRVRRRRIF